MGLVTQIVPSHNPQTLLTSYCGPEVEAKLKEERSYSRKFFENLTFAYVPGLFIYKGNSDYSKIKVDGLMKKPNVTTELLESITDIIQDQFECRIAVFWTQMLLVYKTGLKFYFCNTADAQIGKPPGKSPLVPEEELKGKREFAAAHFATLPTLRVVSQNSDKAIAFGQGSFFHLQANATAWVPVVINQVDSNLDIHARVKKSDHSFRYLATGILNQLSRGDFDPREGLMRFLKYAKRHIRVLRSKETSQEKLIVIQHYLTVAKTYMMKIEKGNYLIQALSGLLFTELRGEEFYMHVQAGMHRLFKVQMEQLQPKIIFDPLLVTRMGSTLNPKRFVKFIDTFFDQNQKSSSLKFTPTVAKYVKISASNSNVRTTALIYLTQISQEELASDLKCCLKIKTSKTIAQVGLPKRIYAVYCEIMHSLTVKAKKPQNMNTILIKVLGSVSETS